MLEYLFYNVAGLKACKACLNTFFTEHLWWLLTDGVGLIIYDSKCKFRLVQIRYIIVSNKIVKYSRIQIKFELHFPTCWVRYFLFLKRKKYFYLQLWDVYKFLLFISILVYIQGWFYSSKSQNSAQHLGAC